MTTENNPNLTLTRIIDAPRDLVWKSYTEIERLAHWWGPKGVKLHAKRLELKPGGTFFYGMEVPGGHILWVKWVFREIEEPNRVVTVVSFTDEEGNVQRHPMSSTWPLEMLCDAAYTEEDGKTKLTMEARPINATAEEIQTFVDGHASMRVGFGGTWDQLDEYLATAK